MKNVLLFQFIGSRPQTQTPVEPDADTSAVLAPLLVCLQADDVALDELTLRWSLQQQPSQLVTMALSSRRRH